MSVRDALIAAGVLTPGEPPVVVSTDPHTPVVRLDDVARKAIAAELATGAQRHERHGRRER